MTWLPVWFGGRPPRQKNCSERERALSGVGDSMKPNMSVLARLESMKLPSAPESIHTCCETGDPEMRKDTVITG